MLVFSIANRSLSIGIDSLFGGFRFKGVSLLGWGGDFFSCGLEIDVTK